MLGVNLYAGVGQSIIATLRPTIASTSADLHVGRPARATEHECDERRRVPPSAGLAYHDGISARSASISPLSVS